MAINLAYYTALIQQFQQALALLNTIKPIVTELMQFAEDHMPSSSGGDKLKYVLQTLKGMLPLTDELGDKVDSFWQVFTGLVSGFAVLQKSVGAIKKGTPDA